MCVVRSSGRMELWCLGAEARGTVCVSMCELGKSRSGKPSATAETLSCLFEVRARLTGIVREHTYTRAHRTLRAPLAWQALGYCGDAKLFVRGRASHTPCAARV